MNFNFDNTRLIFNTNFSGDPNRDKFHDSRRKVNVVVPDRMVDQLRGYDIDVKCTKPGPLDDPETFKPTYFVVAQVKFRYVDGTASKNPPKVYLVNGYSEPVLMTEETVSVLDTMRIGVVNCVLNRSEKANDNGKHSMYVNVMYVEQDNSGDPYAEYYRNRICDED